MSIESIRYGILIPMKGNMGSFKFLFRPSFLFGVDDDKLGGWFCVKLSEISLRYLRLSISCRILSIIGRI